MSLSSLAASAAISLFAVQPFVWKAPWAPYRPLETIRVRVFPHFHDYYPQGKDGEVRKATIVCAKDGRETALDSRNLQGEAKIDCDGPARLVREKGKQAFSYVGYFLAKAIPREGADPELQIVNVLPFETYIEGVVPIEMPAYWPDEALKAQAVAARTYALYHASMARELGAGADFDVDDTIQYQAYTGVTDATEHSNAAVLATVGEYLSYQGRVIQAFFFEDSGGYTESASEVFGPAFPYCQGRKEAYDDSMIDLKRWGPWKVSFTLAELNRKLGARGLVSKDDPVVSVAVSPDARTASGRARTVSLGLKSGAIASVAGTAFRSALGMRSTLFAVLSGGGRRGKRRGRAGSVAIRGRGFGHGVGMSQLGANVLAGVLGWKYPDILSFYYADVTLTPAGSISEPAPLFPALPEMLH